MTHLILCDVLNTCQLVMSASVFLILAEMSTSITAEAVRHTSEACVPRAAESGSMRSDLLPDVEHHLVNTYHKVHVGK